MKYLLFLSITFITFVTSGQNPSLLNTPAPELSFPRLLNDASATAKLSDYRSKVVILEFWATWCAPCIESFPHLETLQQKFPNDLKVITVTDESEERIARFMQKRNLSLPVALDANRAIASKFPHRSIPHTVVIDKAGIIRIVTVPKEITEETIRKVIGGETIALQEKADVMNFDPSRPLSGNENFTFQVTVTPYQNGLPSMSNPTGGNGEYKNRRIVCTNVGAKSLYEVAHRFPTRIKTIVEVKDRKAFDWSEETAMCFDLIVPAELGEKRFDIMKQHLSILLPYSAVLEKREGKVKVLKVIDGQSHALKPSTGGALQSSWGGRGLSMKNGSTTVIAEFLENHLDVPVVDDTRLTELFDVQIDWYNEDPSRIHSELKKIGLELADATRAIDLLVIRDK